MLEIALYAGLGVASVVFYGYWIFKNDPIRLAKIEAERLAKQQQQDRLARRKSALERVLREKPEYVQRRIDRAARKARGD